MKFLFSKKQNASKPASFDYASLVGLNVQSVSNMSKNYKTYRELSMEYYITNVVVNRAISMIAKSAASVKTIVSIIDSNGIKTIQEQGPLINLLKNPNQFLSGTQFIEYLVSYFLISGNAYLYVNKDVDGNIIGLELLRPDRVQILPSKNGCCFKYSIDGMSYEMDTDKNGLNDVLHIKNFNPLNDWYGVSNLNSSVLAADQYNEAIKWNKNLLSNGARPSGAIVMNPNTGIGSLGLTDDQFSRLKKQIDDVTTGSDNAGKIMLLEGGLQWQEMSINPKDMDFAEAKDGAARDIAISLGIPPQLLCIRGDNTYSNMAEARLAFWQDTVLPLLNNVYENITNWIASHTGIQYQITPDADTIEALNESRQILWGNVNSASFLTLNEKREALGFTRLNDPAADQIANLPSKTAT